MRLVSLRYVEQPLDPTAWTLDTFHTSDINLLVGRNATGKTRTINVILSLSRLFTGEIKEIFASGSYHVVFQHDADIWEYDLEYHNRQVTREDLSFRGENVLHRGQGSPGRIQAEDVEGKAVRMKFQVQPNEVAVFSKRDSAQHSFLEPLHEWATTVRHFAFGSEMHHLKLALAVKVPNIQVDFKDTAAVVPILGQAIRELGSEFKQVVINEMRMLGYNISTLEIKRPQHAILPDIIIPGELVGISAKEDELECTTDQPSMSQGMFRSLSLLIQTTYYAMKKIEGCILIDDIGEGLDFERSCVLIDIIREKAKQSRFQLVMSTNNRFVMNRVPLEEWCVLQRKGNFVRVRNYVNSREAFEKFKITGLNNFDLLATNYLEGE
jgi:hypothetical protein